MRNRYNKRKLLHSKTAYKTCFIHTRSINRRQLIASAAACHTPSTPCHRTTRKCSRFSARTHGTRALEPSARHLSRHVPRAALRRRISKVEGQVQLIEQVLESVDQQGAKERSAM